MADPAQAQAYARADFAEVNQSFVDRFIDTFADAAEGYVVDLGCGPGDIVIRLATRAPSARFVGVDGAQAMLAYGREAVDEHGLHDRVDFVCSRVPGVDLAAGSFDAVISNSILHHLRDPDGLWQETLRLGRPGSAVFMMDLKRPASKSAAERIVESYAKNERPILKIDFYNSLLAAFTPGEVRQQLQDAGLTGLQVSEASDRHLLVQGRLPGPG